MPWLSTRVLESAAKVRRGQTTWLICFGLPPSRARAKRALARASFCQRLWSRAVPLELLPSTATTAPPIHPDPQSIIETDLDHAASNVSFWKWQINGAKLCRFRLSSKMRVHFVSFMCMCPSEFYDHWFTMEELVPISLAWTSCALKGWMDFSDGLAQITAVPNAKPCFT